MYSTGIAYLLWLVSGFGALGFHRFYLGKIPTGILWMCTGGLGMFGSIYDFFTLPGQVREANIRQALFNASLGTQNGSWRHVNDGSARVVGRDYRPRGKDSVEQTILKIAKQNQGIVNPSELALEAGISLDDAKKALDSLVSKGIAELRVRKTGTLVYTLPDLADTDSPLEDF